MRFILSMLAVFAFGLVALTACQDTTKPVWVEKAKTNTATAPQPKTDDHGHTDDAPRINLEEAKKAFDSGEAVFVDTRGAATFQKERIKGAINLPAEAAATRFNEIPKGKKIIAYCS